MMFVFFRPTSFFHNKMVSKIIIYNSLRGKLGYSVRPVCIIEQAVQILTQEVLEISPWQHLRQIQSNKIRKKENK